MRIFKPKKINIERFTDLRGNLSVFSSKKNNFKIRRIYLIENKSTKFIRGNHARKLGAKHYYCVSGKIEIEVSHNKYKKKIILKKGELIKIDSRMWIEIKFLKLSTICLVLDNREYNEKEYIRKKYK
jgi:hypothetical protein